MGRRHQRHPRTAPAPLLPPALERTLRPLLGDTLPAFEAALREPPPVSIRLNPRKGFTPVAEPVPWCATGRYLKERPSFTFDPLLHAGAYYVQEASSMFLEQAVRASGIADRDILALDLCAAPGGKSTHLRALLTPGSLLVANEVDGHRRRILEENLWKWGLPNTVITGSPPPDLAALPGMFDLVLVDAPCSGEGMFRKEPFAREQWGPALVERCAAVQRGILAHAWDALAPGGTLMYSTCTWEPAENEEQLRPFLQRGGLPVEVPLDPAWGIERADIEDVIGYRCYPHRLRGEGFFLGMLRKPGERPPRDAMRGKERAANAVCHWLHDAERLRRRLRRPKAEDQVLIEREGVLYTVDGQWATLVQGPLAALRTTVPGTPVAERKGDGWQPHPALALSTLLARDAFIKMELDGNDALAYLRGEALPASGAKGPALAMHAGLPLGWLHGAGGRWNNRWPAPWRVRSQHAGPSRVPWAG